MDAKLKKEGMSIPEIKKIFAIIHEEGKEDYTPVATIDKYHIINASMPLFRKMGYDGVTISDITNAANIGCGKFYKHFKSKKDLFIECIQKIITDEAKKINEFTKNQEIFDDETIDKEANVFFNQTLLWRDMIKNLRAVSISKPKEFSETFEEHLAKSCP